MKNVFKMLCKLCLVRQIKEIIFKMFMGAGPLSEGAVQSSFGLSE